MIGITVWRLPWSHFIKTTKLIIRANNMPITKIIGISNSSALAFGTIQNIIIASIKSNPINNNLCFVVNFSILQISC